ncbi:MAG TPA: flagellar biosynthesis protein FliQ [Phycisphaerae bacterium]|nr:flagellar biosynthesis protein FliQ [Phycisphaerae bacterium]HRR86330.1 flagellar biosynthesis protein FliQ [Phycisphaerae bacterium]
MEVGEAVDMGRDALIMVLTISGPVMAIGLLVGLLISLFQSMTQLHEQTLTFVPKIVAMVGVALVLVPWLTDQLLEYATELLGQSPF